MAIEHRNSHKSAYKISMLKKAIELIASHRNGMTRAMLMEQMHICESSSKTYTNQLEEAGIVTRVRLKPEGKVAEFYYTVCASNAAIGDYLGSPALRKPKPIPPRAKTQDERLVADPSRHFHYAKDDEQVHIKVPHVRIPPRDPLDIAFFGPAGQVSA